MAESGESVKEKLIELMTSGVFAALGGFVNSIANRKKGEPFKVCETAGEILIAIFAGLLVHYVVLELNYSEGIRTISVALAGYSARGVLAILNSIFVEKLNLFKKGK